MATLGLIGTKQDIQFRQGSTCGPFEITFKNTDQTAINLTGCQFKAVIRSTLSQGYLLATFTTEPIDLVNGIIKISIPPSVTSTIPGGPIDSPAEYFWDMEYTNTSNIVIPMFYGTVYVVADL